MGSDALYNEQALLRKAVRFVWAVTGMRTAPPVRAEKGAGSACRFQAHLPHPRRAGILWEVGTLCLGCILRKENPAPAVLARRGMGAGSACGAEKGAGSACRASPAG